MGTPKSWEQYKEECQPIAESKQIQILGWTGEWKGNKTKLDCTCDLHGRWYSTNIHNFKSGTGCPSCKLGRIIPDDQHIQDFINTGKFKPGTTFTNTGKRGCSKSGDIIWMIKCPVCSHDEYVQAGVCDGKFYSRGSDLKKGSIPCRCATNHHYTKDQITYRVKKAVERKGYVWVGWITKPSSKGKFKYLCLVHGEQTGMVNNLLSLGQGCPMCGGHGQQQLYINIVKDDDIIVALKFGIAKDSDRRLNIQNSRNMLFMERICLYDFSTVQQCKAAERGIKKKLKTGILTARELKDGHTETVSVSDLENLQKIVTHYGGKLVYNKEV